MKPNIEYYNDREQDPVGQASSFKASSFFDLPTKSNFFRIQITTERAVTWNLTQPLMSFLRPGEKNVAKKQLEESMNASKKNKNTDLFFEKISTVGEKNGIKIRWNSRTF